MSMIYYCKGVSLMKLKMMCKLYVSLLLPCPRVNSLYLSFRSSHFSLFQYFQNFNFQGLFVSYSSSSFNLYIVLEFARLKSMLKRVFGNMAWAHLTVTQHVLIKTIFGEKRKSGLLYSACRRRSSLPLHPQLDFSENQAVVSHGLEGQNSE